MLYYIKVSVIECGEGVSLKEGREVESVSSGIYVRNRDEASDAMRPISYLLTGLQNLTKLRSLEVK